MSTADSSKLAKQRPERDDIRWILDQLIPILANSGKLLSAPAHVKHADVQRLPLSEAFMLTMCYKIRLTLAAGLGIDVGADDDDQMFQLVVKVN